MGGKKHSKEELRFDNEQRKLRMSQEFGALFSNRSDLPPELENQFLKNIESFEKQYAKNRQVTVYERIGNPDWTPQEKIGDHQIGAALDQLMARLNKNGVSLESVCHVEKREMYRFITEELFREKIDDIPIEGMMIYFTYEEFYPNHKYDVEKVVTEFVNFILKQRLNTDDWFFHEHLKILLSERLIKNNAIAQITNFIEAYSGFDIHKFEITSSELSEDFMEAKVTFSLSYVAYIGELKGSQPFKGKGIVKLQSIFQKLDIPGWDILNFEMPGLVLQAD